VALRWERDDRGGGVGRAVARGLVLPGGWWRRAVPARVREQQGGGARDASREEGARRPPHQRVQQELVGVRWMAAVWIRLYLPQARPQVLWHSQELDPVRRPSMRR
jgi:hypothetical protein